MVVLLRSIIAFKGGYLVASCAALSPKCILSNVENPFGSKFLIISAAWNIRELARENKVERRNLKRLVLGRFHVVVNLYVVRD